MKRHGLLFIALVLPMLLILPQRSSAGHKRFEVSDVTVRDTVTGLIWLRDGGMGPKTAGSPRDVRHDINVLFRRLNDDGYGDCENWHLPSKEELETLVEYALDQGYGGDAAHGGYTVARLLTEIGFDNIGDAPYWTSSRYRHRGGDYWRLDMGDGRFIEDNGGTSRLLPVCFDGPANAEIIDRGKGVFGKHCASCHSSADMGAPHSHTDRSGTLEASKCKFGKNYGVVMGSIRQGTGNGMPAYGRTLSADDIYAVTFYTLTLRCGLYPGF